jgi:hypothetical protein
MALSLANCFALGSCLGLLLQAACVCGPGPNQGGYDEPGSKDPPKSLQGIKFIESEKGDPASVGCADGQREGFADITRHRRVAGCLATWEGTKSLRDKPSGKVCGDDIKGDAKKEPDKGVCTVPADACAPGWHVCGMGGKNDDLKTHTTFKACNKEAGPGKFVAALSHGQSEELCPPTPTPDTVFPCMDSGYCAEPVCCGDGCQFGKCRDGVWKGQTRISLGKAEGCGSVTSERNGGVMCCYDKNEDPPGTAPAATPAPTTADPAATAAATPPVGDTAGATPPPGTVAPTVAPPDGAPAGVPAKTPTGKTAPPKTGADATKTGAAATKTGAEATKAGAEATKKAG